MGALIERNTNKTNNKYLSRRMPLPLQSGFKPREHPAVLTGSAAQAVALTMVITAVATAVPAIPVNQRAGSGHLYKISMSWHLIIYWLYIQYYLGIPGQSNLLSHLRCNPVILIKSKRR